MSFVKVVLILVLIGFGFAAGYVVGGRKQEMVQHHVEQLKNEMAKRTLDLERLLTKTRMRGHLVEVRDALTLAQTHLRHQDFGLAKKSLSDARTALQSALQLDKEGALTHLRPLDHELETIEQSATRLGPRAADEIERIKQQVVVEN